MKKIIFIILIPLNFSFAFDATCSFEEVYKNGVTQQGRFLIKDTMLRYEYFDRDLFTIIAKNEKYYLINNSDKIVQNIDKKTDIFDLLIKIVSDYPNLDKLYENKNFLIKIEKSSKNFIKRISVQSEDVNLSINVFNCGFNEVDRKYFRHFNFVEHE